MDPKELKEILNNIQSSAHEMIEQLEPIYKEKSLPFSHRMIQVLALPLEKSKQI